VSCNLQIGITPHYIQGYQTIQQLIYQQVHMIICYTSSLCKLVKTENTQIAFSLLLQEAGDA
jgi:hypothetical protein